MGRLLDVDVVVWLIACPIALVVGILGPLVIRQGRWQRDADTEDPPGFTSDIGD